MHIGVILDGNRRWGKANGLTGSDGHTAGLDNFYNLVEWCKNYNITELSVWSLAKKNIENRSKLELNHIYKLVGKAVSEMLDKALKDDIKLEFVGNLDLLPKKTKDIILDSAYKTSNNTGLTVITAIGYGGQDEIVRGVKKFIKEGGDIDTLDEKKFFNYLDSGKFKEPDLIIRTGGDTRLSGYFLYASEYSEYYFTDTYWPDFSSEEFDQAIMSLKGAKRNFGK